MNSQPKTTRTTNRQILAELRDLRRELRRLPFAAGGRQSETPTGSLNPYAIAEADCRYLSQEQAATIKRQRPTIKSSSDVERFCREHFRALIERGLQEEFHILTLDGAHHIIGAHQITIGLANSTQVHSREVFRPAILDAACAVILVHNHPSGDANPSAADVRVTKTLADAGRLIGIKVLDHVIVSREGSFSFAEDASHSHTLG